MLRMAVLVSGGGTNLQAIMDAIDSGKITNAEIVTVISNNAGAYALERARKLHKVYGDDLCIVFEDARQRKWIPQEKNASQYRGRLQGAGSVKRDATIWEDFCKDLGIRYEAVPPHKGMTKWSAETFANITGWQGKTSEHARDAALLVYAKP